MSTAQANRENSTPNPTDPNVRRQAEQRAHRRTAMLLPLILAGVLVFGLIVGFHQHRQTVGTPLDSEPASLSERIKPLRDAIGSVAGSVIGPARLIPNAEADAVLVELRQLSIAIELQSVANSSDSLNDAIRTWSNIKEQVLASDDGRRIASREPFVDQFVAINEFCEAKQRSDLLAAESVDVLWSEAQNHSKRHDWQSALATVKKLKESIGNDSTAYRKCVSMLTELANRSASATVSATTLAEAIDAREREFAARLTSARVQQERETESQIQSQLADLRDSSEILSRTTGELEAAIAAIRAGSTPAVKSHSPNPSASRASYNRDMAEIRSLLTPFISPGYSQPSSRDEFQYVSFKSPMSLVAIKKAGGLDGTEAGLEALFRIGGLKSSLQRNDRALGTFPKMNSVDEIERPEIAKRLRRAQRLLAEYGELLVEDKLLSP